MWACLELLALEKEGIFPFLVYRLFPGDWSGHSVSFALIHCQSFVDESDGLPIRFATWRQSAKIFVLRYSCKEMCKRLLLLRNEIALRHSYSLQIILIQRTREKA